MEVPGQISFIGTNAMKEKTTTDKLAMLVMDEIRRHPECAEIVGVTIDTPAGRSWDVTPVRNGARISRRCRERLAQTVRRLRGQYDLV
jgi:hypothetical protein